MFGLWKYNNLKLSTCVSGEFWRTLSTEWPYNNNTVLGCHELSDPTLCLFALLLLRHSSPLLLQVWQFTMYVKLHSLPFTHSHWQDWPTCGPYAFQICIWTAFILIFFIFFMSGLELEVLTFLNTTVWVSVTSGKDHSEWQQLACHSDLILIHYFKWNSLFCWILAASHSRTWQKLLVVNVLSHSTVPVILLNWRVASNYFYLCFVFFYVRIVL